MIVTVAHKISIIIYRLYYYPFYQKSSVSFWQALRIKYDELVDKVGLEPTKPKASDLQSGEIAAIRLIHINGKSWKIRTSDYGFGDRGFTN